MKVFNVCTLKLGRVLLWPLIQSLGSFPREGYRAVTAAAEAPAEAWTPVPRLSRGGWRLRSSLSICSIAFTPLLSGLARLLSCPAALADSSSALPNRSDEAGASPGG